MRDVIAEGRFVRLKHPAAHHQERCDPGRTPSCRRDEVERQIPGQHRVAVILATDVSSSGPTAMRGDR